MKLELWPRGRMKSRLVIWTVILVALWTATRWSCHCPPEDVKGTPDGDLVAMARRLSDDVHVLADRFGARNVYAPRPLEASADWILSRWSSMGLAGRSSPFRTENHDFRNLDVDVCGPPGAPVVIVGAHYDTYIDAPGGDDNDSGVAAMLEVARALAHASSDKRLRCVAFANEEPPFFATDGMGSRFYVKGLQDDRTPVASMICLETIGFFSDAPASQKYPKPFSLFYPDVGNFIGVVGNFASRDLVVDVTHRLRMSTDIPLECVTTFERIEGVYWSDHWSFWRAGIPAVMLSDTAPFRNPHYHERSDTADTLDYPRFARLTAGIVATVRGLIGAK